MAAFAETQNLSQFSFSETGLRGTGCGKSARPGLWGSRKATTCSTRTLEFIDRNYLAGLKICENQFSLRHQCSIVFQ